MSFLILAVFGHFWGLIRLFEPLTSPLQPCVYPIHDANVERTVPIPSGVSWGSSSLHGGFRLPLVVWLNVPLRHRDKLQLHL
ncbi:hypothetical protein QBC32DRAFT_135657 [Pseudoneurospora amorphoporcata]|uniref:Secreted protein n=1 Tax=Pseudoneurospora amorphoporcata TaxID=241081 RepID=A0AAN6NVJ8_9PEZI|nr:hypothetical protein QBC32DRAFT_135657 [Pseudoneurospora amorphoporcata]